MYTGSHILGAGWGTPRKKLIFAKTFFHSFLEQKEYLPIHIGRHIFQKCPHFEPPTSLRSQLATSRFQNMVLNNNLSTIGVGRSATLGGGGHDMPCAAVGQHQH